MPLDGVGPSVFSKAYGGSPPPVDQPGLVALLKSKVVVGCNNGSDGSASDRARPAGTASETSASLCKYSGRRLMGSRLAGSRGGLVAPSLALAARKARRCGANSDEDFARGVGVSSASGWEARSTGSHCGGQAPPRVEGCDSELGRPTACEWSSSWAYLGRSFTSHSSQWSPALPSSALLALGWATTGRNTRGRGSRPSANMLRTEDSVRS